MNTSPYRRLALAFGLVITVAVFWNYWLPTAENYYNVVAASSGLQSIDYFAYYTAGLRFMDGQNPYFWQNAVPEAGDFSDFIYPPTFLPVYGWLAGFPYDQSRLLWALLYGLFYAAAFAAFTLAVDREDRLTFAAFALLLTLTSYPLLRHIHNGQADLFAAGLSLVGLVLYGRGWRFPAALLFVVGTLVKVVPVFFLIFFGLFLRDWRFVAAYLGGLAGLVLLSGLWLPLDWYPVYVFHVLPFISQGVDSYILNQSFIALLSDKNLVLVVEGLGFVLFAVFIWRLGSKYKPAKKTLHLPLAHNTFIAEGVFYLNLLVFLIFIGRSWPMTYVWTILPSALLLTYTVRNGMKPGYMIPVGLAVVFLNSKAYGYPVLDSLNLIGSLVMAVCLGVWLVHRADRISLGGACDQDQTAKVAL